MINQKKLRRKFRKGYFSLIEIVLAIAVIALGIVGIVSLMPYGLQANKDATGTNYATHSADEFLNQFAAMIKDDWKVADAVPMNKPSSDESSAMFNATVQSGTNIYFNDLNNDNEFDYDGSEGRDDSGLFMVQLKTGSTVDSTVMVRVWKEPAFYKTYDKSTGSWSSNKPINANIGMKLKAELSWPKELPYTKRKKSFYSLDVYNQDMFQKAGLTAVTATGWSGYGVSGSFTLNDSDEMQFVMVTEDGTVYSKDDLEESGTTFDGDAVNVWFETDSDGQTLEVTNGEDTDTADLGNDTMYHLSSDNMTVEVEKIGDNWKVTVSAVTSDMYASDGDFGLDLPLPVVVAALEDPADPDSPVVPVTPVDPEAPADPEIPSATINIEGDLNVNPGTSSSNRFSMLTTDIGWIDRDTIHAGGSSYVYEGYATEINIKAKAVGLGGTSCKINGADVQLKTSTRYTISSKADPIQVKLYNVKIKGKALGQFWLQLDGEDVAIDPYSFK